MEGAAVALAVVVALLGAAHAVGAVFAALRQPRVIGELVGGLLVGPPLLAMVWPAAAAAQRAHPTLPVVLDAVHGVGLALLLFLSGARMRELLAPGDRRAVAWLAVAGTALPFVATLAVAPLLPLDALAGPSSRRAALVLVLGVAIAVTSIPVIARIFHDLELLGTRFARLVLAVAVVEDVALWVVLAIALTLARAGPAPGIEVARSLALTVAFVAAAATVLPIVVRRRVPGLRDALLEKAPLAWPLLVLAATAGAARLSGVGLVLAAFFAGLALGDDPRLRRPLARLDRFAFATAIPLYFAVVGWRLDLVHAFDARLCAALLGVACLVKVGAVALGGAAAGLRGAPLLNVSVALNARGGPGIVVASVAHEAGIISDALCTALVLLAVVTSQVAGVWLGVVVRRGAPLLGDADEQAPAAAPRGTSASGSGLFLEPPGERPG